jgi:CRISPR/Cas system-associated protein Csm6
MKQVIKDTDFELVTEILKPDAKKRLSLGGAVAEAAAAYNVYRNRLGQIVLDPVKVVPAYEAWLFENKEALASVKRGLADSAAGRTVKRGSFAAHAEDEG